MELLLPSWCLSQQQAATKETDQFSLLQWLVTLPLEITAAAIVVSFWTEAVPAGVWITIFYLIIIIINLFGTRG